MDLLSKTVIIAVILVVVVIGIYYAFQKVFPSSTVTEPQAVQLVTNYLMSNNPDALVNVTNVTPSQYAGSWHIIVSFINNPTTPCPTYLVYSYDYPKYGFVNRTDNVYTQNCQISGLVNNMNYTIGSFPVAIVRSYTLNTSSVMAFVQAVGYSNVVVHARNYSQFTFEGQNLTNVWVVNYSAANTNRSVFSVISQVNGKWLGSYNSTH